MMVYEGQLPHAEAERLAGAGLQEQREALGSQVPLGDACEDVV